MRTSVLPRLLPLSAVALALGGCSSFNFSNEPASVKGFIAWVSPYKADIVQGNVVTTEQIAQVKTGMSRLQVRDVLGTPLISDPFHAQRWDYVFTMRRQGFEDQQRSFFVIFDNDAVQKVDSPALPSEDEFVAQISRKPLPTRTPKLALTAEERAALPMPAPVAQTAASAAAPLGAARKYPPLELE